MGREQWGWLGEGRHPGLSEGGAVSQMLQAKLRAAAVPCSILPAQCPQSVRGKCLTGWALSSLPLFTKCEASKRRHQFE